MSGHTPGPWTVNGFGGSFEVLCRTRDGVAVSATEPPKDGIANARLIAAAPDLLEALSQFVRAVKFTSGVSLEFATQEAEKAIAKAEGR
jgi:uncharacterized protein YggU (UPF0235/DUF167 family)